MKPALETGSAQAGWEQEMAGMPRFPDWQGWEESSGMGKAEYFAEEEPARRCVTECRMCGFYYLNDQGGWLKRHETPMCGEWEQEGQQ